MNNLKVLPCTCKDEFQDATYGPKRRVMNPLGKSQMTSAVQPTHVCTVCGAKHKVSGNSDNTKKSKKTKENDQDSNSNNGKKGKKNPKS